MQASDTLLVELEGLLQQSFKDVIVWDQKDADLIGKYVYIKYEGKEVGLFLGYQMASDDSVRGAITFFFSHPSSSREASKDVARLFHKLLIRLNLRLRSNQYKLVAGRSPALIRMKYFAERDMSSTGYQVFFKESMEAIKKCEPLYKTASG